MRLGIIVRGDEGGLGYQTRDYYKHLKPSKTILIDISALNGKPVHREWYPDYDLLIEGLPSDDQIDLILDDIDVLLTAETPYSLKLYARAKLRGVKTVCVENPEFYDHILYPEYDMPDLIILPSVWLEPMIREHAESRGTRVVQLHHPVDRNDFPFTERSGHTLMHIAGNPAMHDRNGTDDFLQACHDGTVTTQDEGFAQNLRRQYRHSTVWTDIHDPQTIYALGDAMVMPRKYGGNCLPLNEALSSGMPVIMTDVLPNSHLLPLEWLVPARIEGSFAPRFNIDIYQADHDLLYDKIAWLRGCDMAVESRKANAIADTISWSTLLPKWQAVIESVL